MKRILILPLIFSLVGLSSCKDKTDEVDYNPNVQSAKDYVRAEDGVLEILDAFFKGVHDTAVISSGFNFIDACSVRYYPEDDSMTYGYGQVNRLCQDGKFRRGMFVVVFDGNVFNENVTANIWTDSLMVDDLPVELEMKIKNLGLSSDTYLMYSVNVNSSLFILPDTTKIHGISITTDFILAWTEGYQTPEIHEDDTYMITGSASGLSSDLYEFSVNITDSLVNYVDCFWLKSGKSQITVPSAAYPDGIIDYIEEDGCYNEFHFYFNDNLFYEVIK